MIGLVLYKPIFFGKMSRFRFVLALTLASHVFSFVRSRENLFQREGSRVDGFASPSLEVLNPGDDDVSRSSSVLSNR